MTVKTEVNGDSKRTNDNGPSLDGTLDSRALVPVQYIDFCPALAALVSPVQILFSQQYIFHFISLHRHETWAGRRAGSPVSVSLSREKKGPKRRTLNVSTTN